MRVYKLRDKEGKEYIKNLYIYEINMDYYREFWYNEEDERKIYNSRMYEAKQSGIEEGRTVTAANFKNLGIDIETISKATGLSKEEIEKL